MNLIDRANFSVEGPRLLFSLRKQARVAALFALMAAASANGGSIGGNSIANNIPNDVHVEGQHGHQHDFARRDVVVRPEEAAAAGNDNDALVPPARCVSPEPLAREPTESVSCSPRARSSTREAGRQELMSIDSSHTKRRRVDM